MTSGCSPLADSSTGGGAVGGWVAIFLGAGRTLPAERSVGTAPSAVPATAPAPRRATSARATVRIFTASPR